MSVYNLDSEITGMGKWMAVEEILDKQWARFIPLVGKRSLDIFNINIDTNSNPNANAQGSTIAPPRLSDTNQKGS